MNSYEEYLINADTCPDKDNIIIEDQCNVCEHYKGTDKFYDKPCVKCSYYTDNTE